MYWNAKLLLPMAAAMGCVMGTGGALAQSASDFRLQPGTAAPRAQGPVDPENPAAPPPTAAAPAPVVAPVVATPAPAVTPQPGPLATITPAPVSPAGPRAAASAAPAPVAGAPAAPAQRAPAAGVPGPAATTAAAVPDAAPVAPLPAATAQASAETGPAPQGGSIAWWWLIPAALIGAGGAFALLWRRRGVAVPVIEPLRPVSETDAADADGGAAAQDEVAAPVVAPAPASAPAYALPDFPVSLVLEAERLSVSLVNATLQYRLSLTNRSAEPLGPIAIAADMIAAHASRSSESQLGTDGTGLELRHELGGLEPGASAELKGELRLPLAEVTPIRAGAATLLVPLVRLRTEAAGMVLTQAVVVGETPLVPGRPLRPFRLDTGPRIFGAVSQREIGAAA
ncbi:hypothetical protein H7F51_00610 [Novosphingobium flavum]|uniref:Uncharacterized protein n=1 Tax=Novosphingobium flavum TaxID=1778672 RepID=A0A7X1FND4_9SPHN|nr:hypothetical protein [Novosphingobium flavum]MBC2664010.1 hypothetical protein [Novosphingobium flavum]